MEEQQQTPEETPEAKKKRKQHEAYRRWYTSDRGKTHRESKLNRQRIKERNALTPEPEKQT